MAVVARMIIITIKAIAPAKVAVVLMVVVAVVIILAAVAVTISFVQFSKLSIFRQFENSKVKPALSSGPRKLQSYRRAMALCYRFI